MGTAYSRSLYTVIFIAVTCVYMGKAVCEPNIPKWAEECKKHGIAFVCDQHSDHCTWVEDEFETDDESEEDLSIAAVADKIAPPFEMKEDEVEGEGEGEGEGASEKKVDIMEKVKMGDDAQCNAWASPTASQVSHGSSGVVYKIHDKAIKGYGDKSQCKGAQDEFATQQKIFNLFHEFSNEWILQPNVFEQNWAQHLRFILHYLKIPEPGVFCEKRDGAYSIGKGKENMHIKCFYTMTMLHGITNKMWESILDEKIFQRIQKANKHVTGHLIFAMKNDPKPYDPVYNAYSFTTGDYDKGKPLDKLKKQYKFVLNEEGALQYFGFMNGLISVALHAESRDVEFSLGYYTGIWKVNMIDFGSVDIQVITKVMNPQKEMEMSCTHGQAAKATNKHYQYGWDFAGNVYFYHWCTSQTAAIHSKDVTNKANEVLRDKNPRKQKNLKACLHFLREHKLLSGAHVMYRNEYNYEKDNLVPNWVITSGKKVKDWRKKQKQKPLKSKVETARAIYESLLSDDFYYDSYDGYGYDDYDDYDDEAFDEALIGEIVEQAREQQAAHVNRLINEYMKIIKLKAV